MLFYTALVNKCSGSCSDINNPHAKLCVPDVIKNMNVKVINLLKHLMMEHWNSDKSKCECKELFGKGRCADGFL